MVSHDKKKDSSILGNGKAKVMEALISERIKIDGNKDRSGNSGSKHKLKNSVVSAIVFDRRKKYDRAGFIPPVNASIFQNDTCDLAFSNKMRNVIEYTFECLRDSVSDQKPMAQFLQRSIKEMKSLSTGADKRLKPETLRHLNELIEETEAFVRGEKTALTGSDEHEGVQHYRHYVRIAWLTHFILCDLNG
jgi:hypothetical protein